jgi:anti-sigma B factor antagonist
MPLTITSEPGEGFVTIRPAGSLDSNTYTDLQEHIAAQKTMKAAGGGFAVVNLQPQIRKVFEIIMALPFPNVFESVADLDRYLVGIQKKVRGA